MIRSFKDEATKAVFEGRLPKGFPASIFRVARRKLEMLNAARALDDLRSPPGNRLHALTHDRNGQHAIRINEQFRICFVWEEDGPSNVEVVDYH
jgi:proteic killer suppression protein